MFIPFLFFFAIPPATRDQDKDLKWETVFRAGLLKKKEMLQKALVRSRADLKNMGEYRAIQAKELKEQSAAVQRERAARLLDLHKLLEAEVAEKKAHADEKKYLRAAEAHHKELSYYKNEVGPLYDALAHSTNVWQEELAELREKEEENARLAGRIKELEGDVLRQKEVARDWQARHDDVEAAYGELQRRAGVAASTASARSLLVSTGSPLRSAGAAGAAGGGGFGGFGDLSEHYGSPLRSMSPTYGTVSRMRFPPPASPALRRRGSLPIMTDEERRKACIPKYADTAVPLVCRSRGSCFGGGLGGEGWHPEAGGTGALGSSSSNVRPGRGRLRVKQRRALAEKEAAQRKRLAEKARIAHVKSSGSTPGSLYIGRGLGLRKTGTAASPLTAGSPTQILERILKK